jgi:hypothetical protein
VLVQLCLWHAGIPLAFSFVLDLAGSIEPLAFSGVAQAWRGGLSELVACAKTLIVQLCGDIDVHRLALAHALASHHAKAHAESFAPEDKRRVLATPEQCSDLAQFEAAYRTRASQTRCCSGVSKPDVQSPARQDRAVQ